MKKVNLMLMVIGFIAITGAALAFKAMTPNDYCIAQAIITTEGGPRGCVNAGGNALECPQYDPNKNLYRYYSNYKYNLHRNRTQF